MVVYYSAIVLVILCLYNGDAKVKRTHFDFGYYCAAAVLVIVAGLRYQVGTDYPQYVSNYLYLYTQRKLTIFDQPAVTLIAKVAKFIYDDYETWFFIMSCLTIIPIFVFIRKRDEQIGSCIIFYILLDLV